MKRLLVFLLGLLSVGAFAQLSTPGISQVVISGDSCLMKLPPGMLVTNNTKPVNVIIGAPGAGEIAGPLYKDTLNGFFASWAGRTGLRDTSVTGVDTNTIVLWWDPNSSFTVPSMNSTLINGIKAKWNVQHIAVTGLSEGASTWTNWLYSDTNNFKQVSAVFLLSPQPTTATQFGGPGVHADWFATYNSYFWCAVATADPDGFYAPALAEYDTVVAHNPKYTPEFTGLTCGCHSPSAWGPYYAIYQVDPKTGRNMIDQFNFLFPVTTSGGGGGTGGGGTGGGGGSYVSANITDTLAPGEYQMMWIHNRRVYGSGGGARGSGTNVGVFGLPILGQFADGTLPDVQFVTSGLHSSALVVDSATHNLYITGLNDGCWQGKCSLTGTNNWVLIPKDNLGHTFGNVAWISMSASPGVIQETSHILMAKYDGTTWILGQSLGGLSGDSTNGNSSGIDSLPTQVPLPAFIVKTLTYMFDMALDSTGNVWSWGGNQAFGIYLGRTGSYMVPHKIPMPPGVRAVEMAGAEYKNYILGNDGNLYSWGFYGSFLGIGKTFAQNTQYTTPTNLMSLQGFTKPVKHIYAIHTGSFAILSDSTFWAWGDNPEGASGFGNQLNWWTTTNKFLWDEGKGENVIISPVQPMPCYHDFTNYFGAGYYVLYGYARRWNAPAGKYQLRAAGRNKNGVIASGIVDGDPTGNIEATYPESWNDTVFREVAPFNQAANSLTMSPYCRLNPSGSPCSNFPAPTNTAQSTSAGVNQTVSANQAFVVGTATANGTIAINGQANHISNLTWTGPCGISFQDENSYTTTVYGLQPGPNVITLTTRDGVSNVVSSSLTITYSNSIPPTVSAGFNQVISNGSTTTTLTGSATGNGGATITTYAWTQIAGPTATITSPNNPITTVTGLQPTNYTFKLTVTDSNGNTAFAVMSLVINCSCIATPIPTTIK